MTSGPRRGRASSLPAKSKTRGTSSRSRSRSLSQARITTQKKSAKRPGRINRQRLIQDLDGFDIPADQVSDGYSLDSEANGYQRTAIWQTDRGSAFFIRALTDTSESTLQTLTSDFSQLNQEAPPSGQDAANYPTEVFLNLEVNAAPNAASDTALNMVANVRAHLGRLAPDNMNYQVDDLGGGKYRLRLVSNALPAPLPVQNAAAPTPRDNLAESSASPQSNSPNLAPNIPAPPPRPNIPAPPLAPPLFQAPAQAANRPPNRPIMRTSMTVATVQDRKVTGTNPPTVIDQRQEITAYVQNGAGPEPTVLSEMRSRYQQPEQTAGDDVIQEFAGVGAFVRKIGAPTSTENPVTKDLSRMSENAPGGKNASQPILMPATFVTSQVPINLTNAGGNIVDSSGLVLRGTTQMAPSTKEHNKSARLANILKGQTDLTADQWSGIVRAAVEEKGGRSYDNIAELSQKLQSMNDRRLGNIPDLSTSELLVELFTYAERAGKLPENGIISPGWFLSILDTYTFNNGERLVDGSPAPDKPLPQYIRDNLVNRILVEIEANDGSNDLNTNLASLTAKVRSREVREHSIYTQNAVSHGTFFQDFQPAARYYLPPAERQRLQSGEKSEGFYDGSSFRTTEALLLPADGDVAGVYVNTHSSQSILQALYIANEFFHQTGRILPLLTYESQTGSLGMPALQKMSMDQALDLMRSRLESESAAAQLAQPASDASAPATAEVDPVTLFESTLGRSLTPQEIDGTFRDEVIRDLAANKNIDSSSLRTPFNQLEPRIGKARLESFISSQQKKSTALPPQAPPKKRTPDTIPDGWPG